MKGGSSSYRFVSVPLRLVQELRQLSALRQTLQEMMPGYLVSNLQANEAPARQSCNDAGVGAIA